MKPTEPHPSAKNRTSDVPKAASLIQWIQITRTSKPHYGSPEGQVRECFYDLIRSIIFCPVFMTRELVSTFLERESFEVQNIFHLHLIKKKKPQKKCSCVKPSTFLSLKVTWEIKISKWKKKSGERKKIWGGILFFYYNFFVNFFLLTFSPEKNIKMLCVKVIEEKKNKNHKIIIKNTFSPRVKLKKISGEKKLFFSVWKKSPDSK